MRTINVYQTSGTQKKLLGTGVFTSLQEAKTEASSFYQIPESKITASYKRTPLTCS